ncbi:MAG: Ig-like domain-containing protein, partial [Colwellia sp.]
GNATDLVVQPHAIYAATAFAWQGDNAVENPVDGSASRIGGQLATIENDLFVVVDQTPQTSSYLLANQELTITFNRVLDQASINSESLKVLRSGADQPIDFEFKTSNGLTKVVLNPQFDFEAGIEYELVADTTIMDISGKQLQGDYRFRFIFLDAQQATLESISSNYVSWRGQEAIDLYGRDFYPDMGVQIGDMWLDTSAIEWIDENHIRITLSQIDSAQFDNDLLSISLGDETQSQSYLSQLNVVSDPQINKIGLYQAALRGVDTNVQVFTFNKQERLAIQGKGYGPFTGVWINGIAADNVQQVSDDVIVFDQPINTLNTMTIEISNDNGISKVANTDLSIELQPTTYLSSGSLDIDDFVRSGNLLATNVDRTTQLLTTEESQTPYFLSTIITDEPLSGMGMQSGYFVGLLQGSKNVSVYSLANIYAPEKVNEILNPQNYSISNIKTDGRTIIASGSSTLYIASVWGAEWKTILLNEDIIDTKYFSDYVLVLTDTQLHRISLKDQNNTRISQAHGSFNPASLLQHHGLVAIVSEGLIEWMDVWADEFERKGYSPIDSQSKVVMNGEVLIVASTAKHSVYDINVSNTGNAELNKVLEYSAAKPTVLNYVNGLSEWLEGKKYWSVRLPLLDAVPNGETKIREGNANVRFEISQLHENWSDAVVALETESSQPIDGSTRIAATQLVFETIGTIAGDAKYTATLPETYQQYVTGLTLQLDRYYQYTSLSVLDEAQAVVHFTEPNIITTASSNSITLHGENLHLAIALLLNEESIDLAAAQVSESSITFQWQAPQAGLYGVSLVSNSETLVVPAVLNVVAPLSVSTVESSLVDKQTTSDLGGD